MGTKGFAIDQLRRALSILSDEQETLLQDLPSMSACLEYVALLDEYGVYLFEGVCEQIESGEDARSALAFVRKHKLPAGWRASLEDAARTALAAATNQGAP